MFSYYKKMFFTGVSYLEGQGSALTDQTEQQDQKVEDNGISIDELVQKIQEEGIDSEELQMLITSYESDKDLLTEASKESLRAYQGEIAKDLLEKGGLIVPSEVMEDPTKFEKFLTKISELSGLSVVENLESVRAGLCTADLSCNMELFITNGEINLRPEDGINASSDAKFSGNIDVEKTEEDAAQPAPAEEVAMPSASGDAAQSAQTEETAMPSAAGDAAQPTQTEETAMPSAAGDAVQTTQTEEAAMPSAAGDAAEVDAMSEAPEADNNTKIEALFASLGDEAGREESRFVYENKDGKHIIGGKYEVKQNQENGRMEISSLDGKNYSFFTIENEENKDFINNPEKFQQWIVNRVYRWEGQRSETSESENEVSASESDVKSADKSQEAGTETTPESVNANLEMTGEELIALYDKIRKSPRYMQEEIGEYTDKNGKIQDIYLFGSNHQQIKMELDDSKGLFRFDLDTEINGDSEVTAETFEKAKEDLVAQYIEYVTEKAETEEVAQEVNEQPEEPKETVTRTANDGRKFTYEVTTEEKDGNLDLTIDDGGGNTVISGVPSDKKQEVLDFYVNSMSDSLLSNKVTWEEFQVLQEKAVPIETALGFSEQDLAALEKAGIDLDGSRIDGNGVFTIDVNGTANDLVLDTKNRTIKDQHSKIEAVSIEDIYSYKQALIAAKTFASNVYKAERKQENNHSFSESEEIGALLAEMTQATNLGELNKVNNKLAVLLGDEAKVDLNTGEFVPAEQVVETQNTKKHPHEVGGGIFYEGDASDQDVAEISSEENATQVEQTTTVATEGDQKVTSVATEGNISINKKLDQVVLEAKDIDKSILKGSNKVVLGEDYIIYDKAIDFSFKNQAASLLRKEAMSLIGKHEVSATSNKPMIVEIDGKLYSYMVIDRKKS